MNHKVTNKDSVNLKLFVLEFEIFTEIFTDIKKNKYNEVIKRDVTFSVHTHNRNLIFTL